MTHYYNQIQQLIKKAECYHSLSKDEVIALLLDKTSCEELFTAADRVRKKYVGDEVHLRGLIEFSSVCVNNCLYCGLRKDNKNAVRYCMKIEEILDCVKVAQDLGLKTIVLQGGENNCFNVNEMVYLIKEIKKYDTALTLSIGEKSYSEYEAYKTAGADRFLIRIETTDKTLYTKMHPGMSFDNRIKCIETLKELSFETGTGSLVGLPGQTVESLADDILFFKSIGADMIGIGPFISNPYTPLKDVCGNNFDMALKVMSITRLLMPDINIPATTAMETLHPEGRLIALKSGANVVMPNITYTPLRKYYELYPGKSAITNTAYETVSKVINMTKSINRYVSNDYGFRNRF